MNYEGKGLEYLYNSYKNKYPSDRISYSQYDQIICYETDSFRALFTDTPKGLYVRFVYNTRNYDLHLQNENEVYGLLCSLRKNKVTIDEETTAPLCAKIHGVLEPRLNKRNIAQRIIPFVLGLAIIILSCCILIGGYSSMSRKHFTDITEDIGLAIFFLFIIYAGVSLIRYACGRFIYPIMNFLGILAMGFGICLIFFMYKDLVDGGLKLSDFLGTSTIFLIIIIFGVFLVLMSYIKRTKTDIIIRRTPNLPPKADIDRLFHKLSQDNMVDLIEIKKSYNEATYTGSRAGGIPYSDYYHNPPVSTRLAQPMTFLFQIRLEDLGADTSLPSQGLLQFYSYIDVDNMLAEIQTLYFQDVNEPQIQPDLGITKALSFETKSVSDFGMFNYDILHVYNVANELGIYLELDLGIHEIFGERMYPGTNKTYLLGPAIYMAPRAMPTNQTDMRIDKPLITISSEDPITQTLVMNSRGLTDLDCQVFTSTYNLSRLQDRVITVEKEYGYY